MWVYILMKEEPGSLYDQRSNENNNISTYFRNFLVDANSNVTYLFSKILPFRAYFD
jgi:hypothetical protein